MLDTSLTAVQLDAANLYIGGAWRHADGGETLALENPSDRSVLARIARGDARDADAAVAAARAALDGPWGRLHPLDKTVYGPARTRAHVRATHTPPRTELSLLSIVSGARGMGVTALDFTLHGLPRACGYLGPLRSSEPAPSVRTEWKSAGRPTPYVLIPRSARSAS